jgi:type II secretory pathway pseudopilin PulG
VVTIIILSLGLLFPAAQLIRQSAKRRLAQEQAQSLVQAIKQYRTVYEKWPGQAYDDADFTTTNHPPLIEDLTNNPRSIVFVQLTVDSTLHTFLDPWQRPYIIAVDWNNDGRTDMEVDAFGAPITTNVKDTVAVASWGPAPANEQKRVYSWVQK